MTTWLHRLCSASKPLLTWMRNIHVGCLTQCAMCLLLLLLLLLQPYGDLAAQAVQRFESVADLEKHHTTIEEREEYEQHIVNGVVVYAGVVSRLCCIVLQDVNRVTLLYCYFARVFVQGLVAAHAVHCTGI
jgi:hypothetical protein